MGGGGTGSPGAGRGWGEGAAAGDAKGLSQDWGGDWGWGWGWPGRARLPGGRRPSAGCAPRGCGGTGRGGGCRSAGGARGVRLGSRSGGTVVQGAAGRGTRLGVPAGYRVLGTGGQRHVDLGRRRSGWSGDAHGVAAASCGTCGACASSDMREVPSSVVPAVMLRPGASPREGRPTMIPESPISRSPASPDHGPGAPFREESLTDQLSTREGVRDLHAFIAGLPKAELHVHHVGSASPRIVAELAARHPDVPGARRTPRRSPTTSRSPTSPTSSRSTCPSST